MTEAEVGDEQSQQQGETNPHRETPQAPPKPEPPDIEMVKGSEDKLDTRMDNEGV